MIIYAYVCNKYQYNMLFFDYDFDIVYIATCGYIV